MTLHCAAAVDVGGGGDKWDAEGKTSRVEELNRSPKVRPIYLKVIDQHF